MLFVFLFLILVVFLLIFLLSENENCCDRESEGGICGRVFDFS